MRRPTRKNALRNNERRPYVVLIQSGVQDPNIIKGARIDLL